MENHIVLTTVLQHTILLFTAPRWYNSLLPYLCPTHNASLTFPSPHQGLGGHKAMAPFTVGSYCASKPAQFPTDPGSRASPQARLGTALTPLPAVP